MLPSALRLSAARRRLWLLRAFIGACAACALLGLGLGLAIARHVPDEADRRASAAPVGQPIPTSFGTLTVRDFDQIAGVSADDLGGADHAAHTGINDLTTADQTQVITHVLVTNTSGRAVPVSGDAFRLISATSDTPVAPLGDTLAATSLWPGASLDLAVRFAVPRDDADLWLEFHDPRGAAPARVALGATDQAPAGAHQH